TWGELRRLLPEWAYEQILGGMDEAVTFEEFVEKLRAGNRSLSLSEAREEFDELSVGARFPQETDPFAPEQLWGYVDGYWPEFPAKRMLDWVPDEIQEEFSERVSTMLNGEQLHFDTSLEQELIAAFVRHGYACKRNEDLVYWACGGIASDVLESDPLDL